MRSVVVDTNLLVLLLIGTVDRAQVGRHRRIRSYDVEQFDYLRELCASAPRHFSTPHILTETSNLLEIGNAPRIVGLEAIFTAYVNKLNEVFEPSESLVAATSFSSFGLTDTAILRCCARHGATVITDDVGLHRAITSAGGQAENLWHSFTPRGRK